MQFQQPAASPTRMHKGTHACFHFLGKEWYFGGEVSGRFPEKARGSFCFVFVFVWGGGGIDNGKQYPRQGVYLFPEMGFT